MKKTMRVRKDGVQRIYSELVLAGIAITGMAHIPAPKEPQPGVASLYLNKGHHSPYKSEARKQEILTAIREKTKPRVVNDVLAEKLCVAALETSGEKMKRLIAKRAQELRVGKRFIKADVLAKRSGIVQVSFNDEYFS